MYTVLPPSLRIGVVRGGPSPDYETSLQSGAHVLDHLSVTHRPLDIFISRDGLWHINGMEKSPERILKHVDVVFNAIHGDFGEDGKIQELLHFSGVPYTGSDRLASSLAYNKVMTKDHAFSSGIRVPIHVVIRQVDNIRREAKKIYESLHHTLVIKPIAGVSSRGIYIVESFKELVEVLEHVLSSYPSVMVEEYISGHPVSCVVLDDFRGQTPYAFPPHYIHHPRSILREEVDEVENIAKHIHTTLQLSHFSQSDFIVSPRRGVYFLEVNTIPRMTPHSVLSESLKSVGSNIKDFVHHSLLLALNHR
jgi:D-alanine-D-alanine ligase